MEEITARLEGADLTVFEGYAPTGAQTPYVVHRPLYVDTTALGLAGNAIDWDFQTTLYCCGASVVASFNLALAAVRALQGERAGGTTLDTSIGYTGTLVEGHYESQVTVQLYQGGI